MDRHNELLQELVKQVERVAACHGGYTESRGIAGDVFVELARRGMLDTLITIPRQRLPKHLPKQILRIISNIRKRRQRDRGRKRTQVRAPNAMPQAMLSFNDQALASVGERDHWRFVLDIVKEIIEKALSRMGERPRAIAIDSFGLDRLGFKANPPVLPANPGSARKAVFRARETFRNLVRSEAENSYRTAPSCDKALYRDAYRRILGL